METISNPLVNDGKPIPLITMGEPLPPELLEMFKDHPVLRIYRGRQEAADDRA